MRFLLFSAVLLLSGCATGPGPVECDEVEPCEGSTIEEFAEAHEVRFTRAMRLVLEQMTANKAKGIEDPDKREAMKVLAKTDAAKSYAYTRIYAVSADHCPDEVRAALIHYQNRAEPIIQLGHYYYQHGIEAKLGDQDFSQTGEALTHGLEEMLDRLTSEHQQASPSQLASKCREAKAALESLAFLYGGY